MLNISIEESGEYHFLPLIKSQLRKNIGIFYHFCNIIYNYKLNIIIPGYSKATMHTTCWFPAVAYIRRRTAINCIFSSD